MRRVGHDVQRECRIGQGFKQSVIQHVAGAVMAFLAGLEHEVHAAFQRIGTAAQDFGRTGQHRHMRVVAAGAHRTVNGRGKRQPGFLGHRQGVHIAAQQDGAAFPRPALQCRDKSGGRGAFSPLQRQVGQRPAHLVPRHRRHQAKLRLGMDCTAQGYDLAGDGIGVFNQRHMRHERLPLDQNA